MRSPTMVGHVLRLAELVGRENSHFTGENLHSGIIAVIKD